VVQNLPHDSVVECTALTKVFHDFWGRGKVLAVDNLDLDILPGEVFGLLGPNGSGKTTTIKMLLGLLYPTKGRARVFGRPPTDTAVKARIGFMPEESYLYRFLDAVETLDYYGRLFKLDRVERRRRTQQLIEMVGLKGAARRPVGQYSKGMARRIGLAQALINDPDLLILDEPTTGLDPIGSRQIKDVIRELARRGKTVLLCSHLLADVEDICDRVAIMYGGRRRVLGGVKELLVRQEVTQINTTTLDEKTLGRLREILEKQAGCRVLSVEHPTDRLEDLFLREVEQAQRERLETSGAEATRGVTEFLSARPTEAPQRVLESLVVAGTETPDDQEEPIVASSAPPPRFEVLEDLVSHGSEEPREEQKAEEDLAVAGSANKPSGPREIKTTPREPDRTVLERLVRKDDEGESSP
jgi:ABC-2 type transport system ATP-binding protein